MNRIAIVDDRKDARETLRRVITPALPVGWVCIDEFPLPSVDEYHAWILEQEISVLVLDEKLNETSETPESLPVNYWGHDVVRQIRLALPTFPIYVVTSYADEAELRATAAATDGLSERDEIYRDREAKNIAVARMCRAGERFVEARERELAELAELCRLAATGQASEAQTRRLAALQTGIGIYATSHIESRGAVLSEFDKSVQVLESLAEQMEKFLGGAK